MATPSRTFTADAPRCVLHHCPSTQCPPLDPDLLDVLQSLDLAGVPVTVTSPRPLGTCDSFSDCLTEQAVATIRTIRPDRGQATFLVRHDACVGCLEKAVRWDLRCGYTVEVDVPAQVAVAL